MQFDQWWSAIYRYKQNLLRFDEGLKSQPCSCAPAEKSSSKGRKLLICQQEGEVDRPECVNCTCASCPGLKALICDREIEAGTLVKWRRWEKIHYTTKDGRELDKLMRKTPSRRLIKTGIVCLGRPETGLGMSRRRRVWNWSWRHV